MNRNKKIMVLFLFLATAIFIFFYFLQWRTWTMYGDDLYIYKNHEGLTSFSSKISIPIVFDKYRPIHGLGMHFLMELFHKHTGGYYAFNVGIQVINTFLFALIVNLFVRSFLVSLLAGLTVGLSRFAYFNITQLLNGGALEGLAMTFFLATLFFLISSFVSNNYPVKRQQRYIFLSILFANACMYTHERYIVLLLFIALMVLLYPGLKMLAIKQKVSICMLVLGSIVLNVVLKKVVYGMPFFVGTAGTNISFSSSSAIAFLTDAILSVFQLNKGPEYLVGIKFTDLPFFDKLLVCLFLTGIVIILVTFIRNTKNAFVSRNIEIINRFWLVAFLIMLLGLCLVPAVVTIRLEQRWLQASYAILVLAVIIAFDSIKFSSNGRRNMLLSFFIILLLCVDFNYLQKGANNIYITYSQKMATEFEKAINKRIIQPGTTNIYIWEKRRDGNSERAINWDLAEGYFFEFYQNQHKNIFYVDSNYLNTVATDTILKTFSKYTDQVINLDTGITDITNDFLHQSPKYFSLSRKILNADSNHFFTKRLFISASDLDGFPKSGFYDNENTIRWTNGNATIGLLDHNIIKDSITLVLNTYLPPDAKNIVPKITLQTTDGKNYQPFFSGREGDKFTFSFYFSELTVIQKINIVSATLPPAPPDQRVLSFPFVSLEIKK